MLKSRAGEADAPGIPQAGCFGHLAHHGLLRECGRAIVGDNFSPVPRVGTITIAGLTFTITQAGGTDCTYNISPLFENHPATGGAGSIDVVTGANCAWQAVSDASWVTVTSGCCGIASGSVSYSVAPNPGPSTRAATITIGGTTFNVKQKAN